MLARLQQVIAVTLALGLIAWLAVQLLAGRPGLALLGTAVVLSAHAVVMGLEMLVMTAINRRDLLPAANAAQVLRAWWGEVLTAPRIFCWQQPFRSRVWPDQTNGRPGQRGVVLVHGFVCNRGLWNRWMPKLHALGIPVIAVNLEPVFGDIDGYVAGIDEAVHALEQSTGLAPVLLAHSMGGLAVRAWLRQQGGAAAAHRMHRVITLGTPHSGTALACLALSANAGQMARLGDWVGALGSTETPALLARFTCVYSNCDNIVFPTSTATLPHADNLPVEACAHVHMVDHPLPWALLLSTLRSPEDVPAEGLAAIRPVSPQDPQDPLRSH
jgi:triacylglycerol lipase